MRKRAAPAVRSSPQVSESDSTNQDTERTRPPRLAFRLSPDPAGLGDARERIRDYLTRHCADCARVDAVILCIEEAWTNAMRHSGSDQDIEVSLHFDGDDLLVCVKDRGRGFDVTAFHPDQRPDLTAAGGRGLYIMAQLMDDLTLRSRGGVEVNMLKQSMRSRPVAG